MSEQGRAIRFSVSRTSGWLWCYILTTHKERLSGVNISRSVENLQSSLWRISGGPQIREYARVVKQRPTQWTDHELRLLVGLGNEAQPVDDVRHVHFGLRPLERLTACALLIPLLITLTSLAPTAYTTQHVLRYILPTVLRKLLPRKRPQALGINNARRWGI